jgi:hypothetical protein
MHMHVLQLTDCSITFNATSGTDVSSSETDGYTERSNKINGKQVLRKTSPGLLALCIFIRKERRQYWCRVGGSFHSCNALSEPIHTYT